MPASSADLESLCEKYPVAYARPCGDRYAFPMFGFECGPGWFQILNTLGAVLEAAGITAVQVKEKFGGLRVYTAGTTPEATAAIRAAEAASETTCELCGVPGVNVVANYWMSTRCTGCRPGGSNAGNQG